MATGRKTADTAKEPAGQVRAEAQAAARQLAIDMARLAQDRNCTEIVVLDLRGVSPTTDYFVIATGSSDRQMISVAEEMAQISKAAGNKAYRVSGRESGKWVLLDFVDVVVHLFDQAHRRFYDLELIWGEAPRVEWQRPA